MNAQTEVRRVSNPDFMRRALELATRAGETGEVPVGAVVVRDGKIIGEGANRPIASHDPSAHAEMLALRQAASKLKNYRLPGCEIYVTLEPCPMCAGLMVHSRLAACHFGAFDPKTGAAGSVFETLTAQEHNHQVEVHGGVLAAECGSVLREFFRQRRVKR